MDFLAMLGALGLAIGIWNKVIPCSSVSGHFQTLISQYCAAKFKRSTGRYGSRRWNKPFPLVSTRFSYWDIFNSINTGIKVNPPTTVTLLTEFDPKLLSHCLKTCDPFFSNWRYICFTPSK